MTADIMSGVLYNRLLDYKELNTISNLSYKVDVSTSSDVFFLILYNV